MKGTELMIGDWVDEKLTFYYGKFVGKHQWQFFDFKEYDDDWEKWISPIPLTAEILEKNGFILVRVESKISHDYYKHSLMDYRQQLEMCPKGGFYWQTNGALICGLTYVHELQHALRLCGLNELADNFKV